MEQNINVVHLVIHYKIQSFKFLILGINVDQRDNH